MQDHPILGQVALGYSPIIDRQRAVVATRLTVFPEHPEVAPDAQALLGAIATVWPADADGQPPRSASLPHATAPRPPVSLNLAGEAMLGAVMAARPGPHLMVEVPAFMAADPAHRAALQHLHESGTVLLIKGRPTSLLAPEVLALFSHSIVDVGEDRRASVPPDPALRHVTTIQGGGRTTADLEGAFERGAVASMGWQWDDEPPRSTGRDVVSSDVGNVIELINGVEREDPAPKLEAVLRRDPTLAFRLLRYVNSPGLGLSVEVDSFAHALMLVGYRRLKRWLALLLASSAKGAYSKPVMFAAVRRGLLMEALGRDQGDEERCGELFICGIFSLLDRLLQQPLSELLGSVPVPERVQLALRGGGGPYGPYLGLVQAIEQESAYDIRENAERVMLALVTVNHAVLAALGAARQLDA